LQEIWDKAATLESQNQLQAQQIDALQQKNNEQNTQLGILLDKSGVALPWQIMTVDSVDGGDTSLAFTPGGHPAISYYDITNTSLKYAVFTGTTWQLTTVDNAGDVGKNSSLKFSPSGQPAISYRDSTNDDLKFAILNGVAWQISTADSTGNVGIDTSLAFTPGGQPAISYYDKTNQDLKYAVFNGSSWQKTTVDSAGDVGRGSSLAFSSAGLPAIGYEGVLSVEIKYAVSDGSTWTISTVYLGTPGDEEAQRPSLAFDPTGKPVICYDHWAIGGYIGLSKLEEGTWSHSLLPFVASDWGAEPSLAFSPAGQPAISTTWDRFYGEDDGFPKLRYFSFNGSTWQDSYADGNPLVGYSSSLAFTPGGQPAISYFDGDNHELKYAVRAPFTSP
jgi:hypothetical protein